MVARTYPNWLVGVGIGSLYLLLFLALLGLALRSPDFSESSVVAGSEPLNASSWSGKTPRSMELAVERVQPQAGVALTRFEQFRIWFTKPVSDLTIDRFLANGKKAVALTGSGVGPYVVSFEPIVGELVTVELGAGQASSVGNELVGRWSYQTHGLDAQSQVKLRKLQYSYPDSYEIERDLPPSGVVLENTGKQLIACSDWRLEFVSGGETVARKLPSLAIAAGKQVFVPLALLQPSDRLFGVLDVGARGICRLQNADEHPVTLDQLSFAFSAATTAFSSGRPGGVWRLPLDDESKLPPGHELGQLSLPVPDVIPGRYRRPVQISFTADDPGTAIWFTNDGGLLSDRGLRRYEGPIRLTRDSTIRAFAQKDGRFSPVGTYTYSIQGGAFVSGLPTLVVSSRGLIRRGTSRVLTVKNDRRLRGATTELWDGDGRQALTLSGWVRQVEFTEDQARYRNQAFDLTFARESVGLEGWLKRNNYAVPSYGRTLSLLPAFMGSNRELVDWIVERVGSAYGLSRQESNFVNLIGNGKSEGIFRLVAHESEEWGRLVYRGAQIEVQGSSADWCALVDEAIEGDLSNDREVLGIAERLDLEAFAHHVLLALFWGERSWPSKSEVVRIHPRSGKWSFAVNQAWTAGRLWEQQPYSQFTESISVAGLMFDAFLRSPRFRSILARVAMELFGPKDGRVGELTENAVDALLQSLGKRASGMKAVFSRSRVEGRIQRTREFLTMKGWADFSRSFERVGDVSGGEENDFKGDSWPSVAPESVDMGRPDVILIVRGSSKRLTVPIGASPSEWMAPRFDDRSWLRLDGLVGFDKMGFSGMRLTSVVEELMYNRSTSALVRIPFRVNSVSLNPDDRLLLRVKINDGFVAYLNGGETLRVNAPDELNWNSHASDSFRGTAWRFREFDLTKYTSLLHEGDNLLALHALNFMNNGMSFLVDVELVVRPSLGRLVYGQREPSQATGPGAPLNR